MARLRTILILAAIAAVVVGAFVGKTLMGRTKYNTGYPTGNDAGTLYNTGLFCDDGTVLYFANPDDDYHLYRMDKTTGDLKKINDDKASYLNADENYIYYVRNNTSKEDQFSFLHVNTNALCRMRKDGKGEAVILDSAPSLYAAVVGNEVYYIHYDNKSGSTLYKVGIDGKGKAQVDTNPYFTCCTDQNYIYFNGLENDHNIYRFDTTTGQQTLVLQCDAWMPIVQNNVAYYMDVLNDYRLVATDLTTQQTWTLAEDRVDCFTIFGSQAIYQKSDTEEPALCTAELNGSGTKVLFPGTYRNLSVVGSDLYFRAFGEDGVVYRTNLLAPAGYSEFHPGKK